MSDGTMWLDRMLAVPAIGITTDSWIGFASGVWEAIERSNVEWKTDGQGRVNIRVTNAVDVRIERDRGLYLALTPSTVVAGYTFNLTAEPRPGALPQLTSDAEHKTFTELQAIAKNMLTTFIRVGFANTRAHDVVRIGVVAESRLVESDAPPGIQRYITDLERAARNKLLVSEGNLVAQVAQRSDGHDQCHHAATRNVVERPDDLELRLDWQRLWSPSVRMNSTRLLEEVSSAIDDANTYAERFGSGEE